MTSHVELFVATLLCVTISGVALESMPEEGMDYSGLNSLSKQGSVMACLEKNCGFARSEAQLSQCVSEHCQRQKKWIDTTHYSEGRRSVLDSLERCIRLECHGKGGMSLKQCAFSCSEKRKRSANEMVSLKKKWVDPLNYGMGDDKRSAEKRSLCRNCVDADSEQTSFACRNGKCDVSVADFLCAQLCAAGERRQLGEYTCLEKCQQALQETVTHQLLK